VAHTTDRSRRLDDDTMATDDDENSKDISVRWTIRINQSTSSSIDGNNSIDSFLMASGHLWQLTPRNGGRTSRPRRWQSMADADQSSQTNESDVNYAAAFAGKSRSGCHAVRRSIDVTSTRVSGNSMANERHMRGRSNRKRVSK